MKTVVIDVSSMLSPLSAQGVEKQLARHPCVHKVEVNYVAGSATVCFDETKTDLASLKHRVDECGYHCHGEKLPNHICVPDDLPKVSPMEHTGHAKMHQNLLWAVAYNVIAFPMAAGVFYPFTISPEVAALAMSGSSALVAVNALLLKRTRLEGLHRHNTSPVIAVSGNYASAT